MTNLKAVYYLLHVHAETGTARSCMLDTVHICI